MGLAAHGGRIYLITQSPSPGTPTEIWSFDPDAASLPDEAVLEGSLPSYSTCSGLAIDAQYYYTACDFGPEPVLRIDRLTLATVELTNALETSYNHNALAGDDLDADGLFDVLYLQSNQLQNYYICEPAQAPFASVHSRMVGRGSWGNYGLALDRTLDALWIYDRNTYQLIRIE